MGNMILLQQGEDINLTLDAELQRYGEQLMINKRGGLLLLSLKRVALITAPSYDPSILVGRQRSKTILINYDSLQNHFTDRGLLAEYPGSPFKILTGLIGLQEGVRRTNHFMCHHGFSYAQDAL
jgi:penicillin-binding protein 2